MRKNKVVKRRGKSKRGKSTDGITKGQRFIEKAKPDRSFAKGNDWWNLRAKHGRDKLFASADLLWEAACEYFTYTDENPLKESQAFAYQGSVELQELPRMRAYSMPALCLYLGCSDSYFRAFKSTAKEGDEDFLTVIARIEQVMFTQKFQGASAGLLNANIISREIGLVDRQSIDVGVSDDIKKHFPFGQ